MKFWCIAVLAELATPALAAESAPLAGCYERVYDAAHLAAHPGQIVRQIRLTIAESPIEEKKWSVATPTLMVWVKDHKQPFERGGGCEWKSGSLVCHAATNATESDDICKTGGDGVRNCRLQTGDAGSYSVSKRADGILVTVRERLEMLEPQSDSAPYLYLSPGNAENRAFLLQPAPESSCR